MSGEDDGKSRSDLKLDVIKKQAETIYKSINPDVGLTGQSPGGKAAAQLRFLKGQFTQITPKKEHSSKLMVF